MSQCIYVGFGVATLPRTRRPAKSSLKLPVILTPTTRPPDPATTLSGAMASATLTAAPRNPPVAGATTTVSAGATTTLRIPPHGTNNLNNARQILHLVP
ncbi:hypothetical protein DV736_g1839, partial [Chaetothyriales sp. CBS 134916]